MLSRARAGRARVGRVLLGGVAAVAFAVVPSVSAAASVQAAVVVPGASGVPGLSAVSAVADEVRYQEQWVLDMLNVEPAWLVSQGAHVTVAVIDSGVDPGVSDLAGSVVTGHDYTGLKTSPDDSHWGEHGTWMASIIAGHGHDGGTDGIIGVAPQAKILAIRVIPDMDDPGYKKYDGEPEQQIQRELAEGILEAVRAHVQVISMSIGYSEPSGAVRAALQRAYSQGIVLVASSGNSGNNDERHDGAQAPVSFPAEYPGVLSVGAVNIDRQPTSFSSGNLSVRIAAPGAAVPAEGRDGQYYTVDGTSPACALVAGVAALIKSEYPGISPALVIRALTSTAQERKPGDYNFLTGFGIVDADAALVDAGRLMGERPAHSQVSSSSHFGGGVAALPAAPVAPRSSGRLLVFAALALTSFAAAVGGLAVVLQRRRRDPPPGPGSALGPHFGSHLGSQAGPQPGPSPG
jgi:subtilisin family serine protease